MWKLPFNLHVKYEVKLTTLPSSPIVKCDSQVANIYTQYIYKHCSNFIHVCIYCSKSARCEIDRGHFAYVKKCLLTTYWFEYGDTSHMTDKHGNTGVSINVLYSLVTKWVKFSKYYRCTETYLSDSFTRKFYVVTYNKFTQLDREMIFLS